MNKSIVKKRTWGIALCGLTILCVCAVFFVLRNGKQKPVDIVQKSIVMDVSDPRKLAGLVDYVFVGIVTEKKETLYDVYTEDKAEDDLYASPYTPYDVYVLKNLKGNLKTNSTLPIVKHGGETKDQKRIVLDEGDFLPVVGNIYVFSVSVQPDGSVLLPGGPEFNKLLAENKRFSFPKDTASANALLEEVSFLPACREMMQACRDEFPIDRVRFEAPEKYLSTDLKD